MADGQPDLSDLYESAGRQYNVDPDLLQAVARVESGERTFDNRGNIVTSPAGAQGIMQFIPSTAKRYGVNVADPASSINGAAHYLSDLLNQTGGDVAHSLALYNGSPGDARQTYAKQILAKYTPGDRQVVQTAGPPANDQEQASPLDKLFGSAPTASATPGNAPGTMTTEPTTTQGATLDKLFPTQTQQTQPQPQQQQPSWFQRNVAQPARGIFNPQLPQPEGDNSLFGMPAAQRVAAGVMAGGRDVAQGLVHAGNWVRNEVGAPINPTWQAIESKLAEQNAAWEQQHGGEFTSWASRLGGDILAAGPFTEGALAATPEIAGAAAIPRIANTALRGGVAGGATNVLTAQSQGQDPGNALLEGAAGGAALGGATGAAGAYFNRMGGTPGMRQALGNQLGIRISTGQRLGGAWQRIEDTAAPLPGSGAARFAGEQRGDISAMIDRELTGQAQGGNRQITSAYLNQQEGRIGNAIDQAANQINVTAPPGNTTFIDALNNIRTNAQIQGPQTSGPAADALYNQITSIMANNNNAIPGPEFARLIARGNVIDSAARSADPNIAAAGRATREALFNAAQNSPTAPRAALDALQQGRYQWKVLQTVEPAIERSVGGTEEMSLARLAQSIYTNPYTRPNEPLYGLMQLLGSTRGLASSGTAERAMWQRLLLGGEAAGGAGAAWWAAQHPDEAEHYAVNYGLPVGATLLGARALRFGPGMGYNWLQAAQQAYNPLLPRIAGPYTGRQILGQQQ